MQKRAPAVSHSSSFHIAYKLVYQHTTAGQMLGLPRGLTPQFPGTDDKSSGQHRFGFGAGFGLTESSGEVAAGFRA